MVSKRAIATVLARVGKTGYSKCSNRCLLFLLNRVELPRFHEIGNGLINLQAGELIEKIKNIRTWQKGGIRAPHKPLLLLYALGRASRGEPGPVLAYK
jgi:hypothetical protein